MSTSWEQDRSKSLHRIHAIEEATALLATGVNMIASPGWQARTGQPSVQILANGVEKLSKVTLGTIQEAETGFFPDQKIMRSYGHDVNELVGRLERCVEAKGSVAGKSYVLELKRELDRDPYWATLVEALDTAASASKGRYVHETALGGTPPMSLSLAHIWQRLDDLALAQLGLLSAVAGPGSRAALVQLRTEILTSVMRWWHLVLKVWQHGMAGETGRQCATEIKLEWENLPARLQDFTKNL